MPKVARLIALGPLATLLIGLSFLSFNWSEKGSEGPEAAHQVLQHPARILRLAMAQVGSGTAPADPTLTAQVGQAIRLAPLEEEPFILAGLRRLNASDYEGAEIALDIARRRNPRSREALYLSADVALAAGDIRRAVQSLETLLRVFPLQGQLAKDALVLLTSDAVAGPAALAALRGDGIKSDALIALARSGAGPTRLIEAIKLTRAAKALASNPSAINGITRPLIDSSDFAGAYRVWSALLLAPPPSQALIRDAGFEGALPPPFGWDIRSSADGYAEPGPDGLMGEIYGRRGTQLALQLLALVPGTYLLEIDANVPNELVEAVVLCVPATEIMRTAIAKEGVVSASFTVPAECTGQWLEIRARASDPPQAGAFQLRTIRILEVGP